MYVIYVKMYVNQELLQLYLIEMQIMKFETLKITYHNHSKMYTWYLFKITYCNSIDTYK